MTERRYRTVLLFGSPGAGKGTQGNVLGAIPGFYHLSSGDVFRSIDVNSPDGREVYQFISQGKLVPDDLTARVWRHAMEGYIATARYKPHEDLLILDGMPRNVNQVEILSQYIDVLGIVSLITPNEEEMIRRITRRAIRENRTDDANEDVIRRRFRVYHEKTAPVLGHYPDEIIHEVDGTGSPAEVAGGVLQVVIPIQNRHFELGLEGQ